jgi:hypothetical protein
MRAIDDAWLVRRLDNEDRALQDSSDLLFASADDLGPLQRLQQARVLDEIENSEANVREPIAWKQFAQHSLFVILAAVAILLWWPTALRVTPQQNAVQTSDTEAAIEQSVRGVLNVDPPAYTAHESRQLEALEGRVEQGSVLSWSLQFAQTPREVRLRFVDGKSMVLERVDDSWQGQHTLDASTLYRIEIDGAAPLPDRAPYRLEVIPDTPPQLRVISPERTLTVLDAATRHWTLDLEASDDYGLGSAQLVLTLAQGSGEQVTVSERRVALRGVGEPTLQRFTHRIDLAAMGFVQGDDLIARLEVRDRRTPTPNSTRSASFILRWPPPASVEGTGVEGLVQQAMPAYFRSQRQIIIDTEALLAQKAQFSRDDFVMRSDKIGADQRLLRLKYGQFLGQETEEEEAPGEGHDDAMMSTGDAMHELMAEAGHMHDLPEAATLLDPETRKLLRSALDEMWQAERELRTGNAAAALPYENRALDFIKRVQQADRIYLARVDLELPQLDPARRLTGDRPGASRRNDPLVDAQSQSVPADVWNALRSGDTLPLDALTRWINDERDTLADPLSLLSLVDALQRDPACAECRDELARQLWSSLVPPAAAPPLRAKPDAVGAAFLDAIAPAEEPAQ